MWIYQNTEFTELPPGIIGFVYMITNTIDGRRYVGKKLLYFTKTKVVNKKKKRIKVESDWLEYFSSSKELQKDVETLGKENFNREILFLCKSKGIMSYWEAKLQFQYEVLENQDQWYNRQIQCRVHASHVKAGLS